ncbi:MAG: toxin-antitoxin system YwqK family antitoxin [Planctomycetes bacterium]|nr:toxin-antitoxin system YwqK family antitoxin [Planctomycetota bacterium]
MLFHRASLRLFLLLLLGLLPSLIAEPDEYQKQFIERFKAKLPQGYDVHVDYERVHRDQVGFVLIIKSLTPVDAQGVPDGEAHFIEKFMWGTTRIVPYKKGVIDGTEKLFAREGNAYVLQVEIPWKNGKIDGVKKRYHPNGKVMSEAPYAAGVATGVSRFYDLAGRLQKESTFKEGKPDGEMVEFYPLTGKQKKIIPYRMGKVDGVVREFHDNGRPKREVPVRDDLFQGIERQFDEEGRCIKVRYWIDDAEVSQGDFSSKQEP